MTIKETIQRDRLEELLKGDEEAIELLNELDAETYERFAAELRDKILPDIEELTSMAVIQADDLSTNFVDTNNSLMIVPAYIDEVISAFKAFSIEHPKELDELSDVIIAFEFRKKIGECIRTYQYGEK